MDSKQEINNNQEQVESGGKIHEEAENTIDFTKSTDDKNEAKTPAVQTPNHEQRTWRVGTFSMGAALLLLGILLFSSKFIGLKLYDVMVSWWPFLLVTLGLEVLLYLFFSRKNNPILKYDILSIFFIGILGTVGIGFAFISTIGIDKKAIEVMNREIYSTDLPAFSQAIGNDVKRIVLELGESPVTVETTTEQEVSMFGTYRSYTSMSKPLLKEASDYLLTNKKGDTLYIKVKGLPYNPGPFGHYVDSFAGTILIPASVKLEINGSGNDVTLKPRTLGNNWTINNASHVTVDVQDKSDLLIVANEVTDAQGPEGKWQIKELKPKQTADEGEETPVLKTATYRSGEGKRQINITNSTDVQLNVTQ